MESAEPKPRLWGIKTMAFVAIVLSLFWLYYLLGVDTRGFGMIGLLLAYFIPTLILLVVCLRFGAWFDVGRRLPRIRLEAYREANRQALVEIRATVAAELARQEAAGASPLELAELKESAEAAIAKTEADAARREALFAKDPALLDKEMQDTIEAIRAKERFKGL